MGNEPQCQHIWDDLLFLKIFRTFYMAVQPSKLIIAFCALAFICLAGWIMDFSGTVIATPGTQGKITELHIYMVSPERVDSYIKSGVKAEHRGVFSTLWHFSATKFNNVVNSLFVLNITEVKSNIGDCFNAIAWAVKFHTIYCIIFFFIALVSISLAGGAICRIAALQCARNEKPGLIEAMRFSASKFGNFFCTPLVPAGIVILLGFFIFLLGLLCNIPYAGEIITSIFMPLALIAGGCIAALSIAALGGFGLMFPAIAYNGTNSLDAMSRSFNYVIVKPWRFAFYTAVAAIYGAICYTFVRVFAFLILWFTHWFLKLGVFVQNGTQQINKLDAIWSEPSFMNLPASPYLVTHNWSEWLAIKLTSLCLLVVIGLLVSFVISFYFSANTIIYSLMRNRVDNTAIDDIYVHFDEAQILAQDTEGRADR